MKLNDVEIEIEASNKEALDFFRHEFVMIRSIQTDKQRKIKCAEKCLEILDNYNRIEKLVEKDKNYIESMNNPSARKQLQIVVHVLENILYE